MKIHILSLGLFVATSVAPLLAQAQIQGDVGPIPSQNSCVILHNDLRYRSTDATTGGEVSQLQDFLQAKGFLAIEPTGYFGLLTQAAVKKFQSASGILSYGYIGPVTRGKIQAASCGGVSTNPTSSPLPDGCRPGDLFSPTTGERCNAAIACTMDVKVCPDGSYVSRHAPSCAFAACPTSVPPVPAPGACAITSFTASPSTVIDGQSLTLSWTTQGCGLVALNAGQQHSEGIYGEINGQALNPSGTMVVYPKTYTPSAPYTMKYSLSAVAKAGDGTKAVEKIITVTILPAASTPSLNVTSPNGGETFRLSAGAPDFRVDWTAQNIPGNVRIYLDPEGRSSCQIGSAPASQGSFSVALGTHFKCVGYESYIPEIIVSPGRHKVYLTAWDSVTPTTPGYQDGSDAYFSITN
jgi:peptidoglycan hydrolase-like protein with peptidoglycan-binding domain